MSLESQQGFGDFQLQSAAVGLVQSAAVGLVQSAAVGLALSAAVGFEAVFL